MKVTVSAIITTYKREPEIVQRAAESVLNQSFRDIELIIVDDSPETFELREKVRAMAEKLDGNVQYIPHEKNMGACAARNTGLRRAKGEYVAFLDDDDVWLPEKIEKQLSVFVKPEIGLVYCGEIIRTDEVGRTDTIRTKRYLSGAIYEHLILENFIGSTSFPLLRKSALEEIGGFDPEMRSAQDYDVWLRLSGKWEVAYVKEPLVVYYIHSGERITSNHNARIAGQRRLIEKNMEYLKQNPHAWWKRHIRMVPEYMMNRQWGTALRLWCQTAFGYPREMIHSLKVLLEAFVMAFREVSHRK